MPTGIPCSVFTASTCFMYVIIMCQCCDFSYQLNLDVFLNTTSMFICSSAGRINVKLEGLNDLKDAVSQATSFKDEAQVYLNNRSNFKEATRGVLGICSLQVLDCLSYSKPIYGFIMFCIFFGCYSIPRDSC